METSRTNGKVATLVSGQIEGEEADTTPDEGWQWFPLAIEEEGRASSP